jgi:formylglycine-generating enzyme required for sulfatase activity
MKMKAVLLGLLVMTVEAAPAVHVPGPATTHTKGREYVYQMDPVPAGLLSARFHLWIPASIAQTGRIRGVIAHSGYNYGLQPEIFRAAHWRQLASELQFAMLLHHVEESGVELSRRHAGGPGSSRRTIDAIFDALKEFGKQAEHPEIRYAGLVFTGMSASGRQAIFLGNALPERTIGVVVYSPATSLPKPLDSSVPVLVNMGGLDLVHGNPINLHRNVILAARAQGAPWAGVYQANVPHAGHGEPSVVMDWVRQVSALRVPVEIPAAGRVELRPLALEAGWLASLRLNDDLKHPRPKGKDAATVVPYTHGATEAASAYWLPTEQLARAWQRYCLEEDVSFREGATGIRFPHNRFMNSVGMLMVAIPPGIFLMGSSRNEDRREEDEVQHEVQISRGFHMGATEVTQAQWQKVMGTNPASYQADTSPVNLVAWNDAQQFCARLSELDGRSYRLPTEAEWEYACRAGTSTPFHYGWSIHTDQANYRGDVGYGGGAPGMDRRRTHPVGQFPPNDWGLHDMHGNVFEWCSDWYAAYPNGPVTDPKGPAAGTARVFRGGSFYNLPHLVRAAFRGLSSPSYSSRLVGLRVVCDESPSGNLP